MIKNKDIDILPVYYPIIQICEDILKKRKLRARHIMLCGGRGGGKTQMILIANTYLLSQLDHVIFNVCRRKLSEVKKQKYEEIRNQLVEFNLDEKLVYTKGNSTFFDPKTYNKIRLDSINDEEVKPTEGGKLDLPIEGPFTNLISNFYEEASSFPFLELIQQHQISSRAKNNKYEKIYFYASNPYKRGQWYINLTEILLPSNEIELEKKGYQMGYFPDYQNGEGAIVIRTNYRINPHMRQSEINLIEQIRDIDYERYKVVGLGMPGLISGAIYSQAFSLMKEVNLKAPMEGGELVGGYDHGWSFSDSSAVLTNINLYQGIDVLDGYRRNNKEQGEISTEKQIDEVIEFFKKAYYKYKKQIKVYIDNAHLPDFYKMFNARLPNHDLTTYEIEFRAAKKQGEDFGVPIRIQVVKYMLATGMLRVSKENCPYLINDLKYCTYEEKKSYKEGQEEERSHNFTHSLNALEYAMCMYLQHFKKLNSMYFDK